VSRCYYKASNWWKLEEHREFWRIFVQFRIWICCCKWWMYI